ncbi:MAG: hypothetical protein ACKOQ7_00020 [Actinomycetota bacterium]
MGYEDDWSSIATKDDLRVLSAELRREIADSARRQTISLLALIAVVNGMFFFLLSAQG